MPFVSGAQIAPFLQALFESREGGRYSVNQLLTDLEKHEGLVIMATNRPQDLDEAMHRRITVAIEFDPPDATLRQLIWQKHIPPTVPTGSIDLRALAIAFELTGGLIKNAVLAALAFAIARDKLEPTVQQTDLIR